MWTTEVMILVGLLVVVTAVDVWCHFRMKYDIQELREEIEDLSSPPRTSTGIGFMAPVSEDQDRLK